MMKEDLIIYRSAKYLGNAIAFALRHRIGIAATTSLSAGVIACAVLKQYMGLVGAAVIGSMIALLVGLIISSVCDEQQS